jgi:hypothetical protein
LRRVRVESGFFGESRSVTIPESPLDADVPVKAPMSIVTAVALLTGVISAAWIVDAGLLVPSRGWGAARIAGLAAGVCWVSGVLALVSTAMLTRAKQPLAGVLSGVLFRTCGPLAALAVGTAVRSLAQAGFPGQVVVFFLVTLATETFLALRVTGTSVKFLSRR